MATATIEYNLDDDDDNKALRRAMNALDIYMVLQDLDNAFRQAHKYDPAAPTTTAEAAEYWRHKLHEILEDRNLPLDTLLD